MANPKTKQIGQIAEQSACDFLLNKGMQLIQSNYHSPYGEIDLIMQDKKEIVFIEVRMRNHSNYGCPIESVDPYKQKKLLKTAIYYLQYQKLLDKVDCRFDIIGISCIDLAPTIEWIKNAFSTDNF